MTAFLPMAFNPSPRPTVVVVFPSPAGVEIISNPNVLGAVAQGLLESQAGQEFLLLTAGSSKIPPTHLLTEIGRAHV